MNAMASIMYISEKYLQEQKQLQYNNYIADMLWAPANGKQFKEVERYIELSEEKKKIKKVTIKDVRDSIANKIKEKGGG